MNLKIMFTRLFLLSASVRVGGGERERAWMELGVHRLYRGTANYP